jgi:hypothetical protein
MSTSKPKSRPATARGKAATERICFQGETGANSHIACQEMFAKLDPMPCPP